MVHVEVVHLVVNCLFCRGTIPWNAAQDMVVLNRNERFLSLVLSEG